MAVRLLTYVGLLLEEIIRREKLKPGDRLPAVLPLMLHNGKSRWRAPLRLDTLFAPVPKDLRRYLPRLTYLLLNERRLDLDRPELKRNPTAAFFRIETNETPSDLPVLFQELDVLLPSGDSGLRRTVHTWLDLVVRRTFPDAIIPEGVNLKEAPMLEETLIKWRDQLVREARREALREGRIKERREMLLELMSQRFGRLPVEVRRQIQGISSIQELRKLGRKVLRAKSPEEMGLG
jgi:putative YhgA-like transposase